jgi:hypothetical protein
MNPRHEQLTREGGPLRTADRTLMTIALSGQEPPAGSLAPDRAARTSRDLVGAALVRALLSISRRLEVAAMFIRTNFVRALSLAALAGAAGCAATDAVVPVKVAPDGQIDIDRSHWKVPINDSGIDGRTVEIVRAPNGHYIAKLIDKGRQLATTVGAYPGAVMMDFVPAKAVNQYVGAYTPIGGEAVEATFSIAANGQEMKTSAEDYRWVRQP